MIGQVKLLQGVDKIINSYPQFSIIVGPKGSGKKTLCKEIGNKLNIKMINCGIKIDDIRSIIDISRNQVDNIGFLIADTDNMSVGAKNSLLKITEEPPRNVFLFMTICNIDSMLETIKSRGTIFTLDNYSKEELIQYRIFRGYNDKYDDIIRDICFTTGDVDQLFGCDVAKFYEFAKCICDNIDVPKNGNAFKISKMVRDKDTDNGYDALLLLKAVQSIFLNKGTKDKNPKYLQACIECGKIINEMQIQSLSIIALMDKWILNVRRVLS